MISDAFKERSEETFRRFINLIALFAACHMKELFMCRDREPLSVCEARKCVVPWTAFCLSPKFGQRNTKLLLLCFFFNLVWQRQHKLSDPKNHPLLNLQSRIVDPTQWLSNVPSKTTIIYLYRKEMVGLLHFPHIARTLNRIILDSRGCFLCCWPHQEPASVQWRHSSGSVVLNSRPDAHLTQSQAAFICHSWHFTSS